MRLIWITVALAVVAGGVYLRRSRALPPSRPPVALLSSGEEGRVEVLRGRAARLVADRGARPENLSEAIALLAECRDILKPGAERRPEPYVGVTQAIREAERLREAMLDDLWVDYQRRSHLRDSRGAQAVLRQILRVVPDRADPRNERARRELSRWLSGED